METAKALIKETVPYMVDGTKTLSELLYGFADELYPGDIHDEPYEGAGYCVCSICQIYVPAARAMEQTIERLTAENKRLTSQVERWQRAAQAHDDFLDSLDRLQGIAAGQMELL